MKILIYANAFAPNVGGVETYVMLLAEGLAGASKERAPIEVTVATRTAASGNDDRQHAFRVVRQPGFRTLFQLIKKSDLIQLAGPCLAPMAIAWLLRKPVVVEHHGYQAACPNGLLLQEPMKQVCPGCFMERRYRECVRCVGSKHGLVGGIRELISTFARRWLCNRARSNVPVSNHVAERLALPRSQVIYYGIRLDSVTVRDAAAKPELGPMAFGYVGRLVAEKGLKTLVRAASILAEIGCDFRLNFIGDGPERADLENAIEKSVLRSRTVFTGYLAGEALAGAAAELSVVVMPSIWEETFGLAALEQMKRGKLIIAADIGGLAEVVDGGGLKIQSGDAEALAQQLRRVLENPAIIEEYRAKARKRAEFFSLDRMITNYIALYRGITNE